MLIHFALRSILLEVSFNLWVTLIDLVDILIGVQAFAVN